MKVKPEHYDWIKDPNGYKKDGHVPFDRCFHCGHRFVGAKYAAYCNICDNYMSPDADHGVMFVVTDKENKIGHWITRRQFVANRIRLPDDFDGNEDQYKKKLESMKDSQPLYRPDFKPANQIG